MQIKVIKLFIITALVVSAMTFSTSSHTQVSKGKSIPLIPKTWDDEAMRSLEIPLAQADVSPKYVAANYYYHLPVRAIYKSYPVYHPDKEPADYMNQLKQQEPQVIFDAAKLKTKQD